MIGLGVDLRRNFPIGSLDENKTVTNILKLHILKQNKTYLSQLWLNITKENYCM